MPFHPVSVLISITAEPRWLSFNKQRVIGKSPVDRDKLGELSTRWDLRSKYSNLCPSSCDVSKSSKFADKICAFNISLCCGATQKRKERNQHCWRCQWGQCWPQPFPVGPAESQNKQILISTSFYALSSFYVLTCRLNYMSQPMLWAPKIFHWCLSDLFNTMVLRKYRSFSWFYKLVTEKRTNKKRDL